jgi:hypothetical protein
MTSPRALADSWGPPRKEHWSANERFVLKVGPREPGKGLSLWERTGDGLERRWERGYVDRTWPPHRAHVTGDGRHVVLQDVYHNLGYGNVIVILGGEGKILGSYTLEDFLPKGERRKARSARRSGRSRPSGGTRTRGPR